MVKYVLHIIADCCTPDAASEILSFLRESAVGTELYAESIQPYWKVPGQGTLVCSFLSSLPMEELRTILADHWEGDVVDARWSRIHVPHAVFLWLF